MDGISSRLLKLTAPGIAGSLTHLFNCSLKTGEVPSEWKSANITPVFKKGRKEDVNNYRPVSVLPIIAKVFETSNFMNTWREITSYIQISPVFVPNTVPWMLC